MTNPSSSSNSSGSSSGSSSSRRFGSLSLLSAMMMTTATTTNPESIVVLCCSYYRLRIFWFFTLSEGISECGTVLRKRVRGDAEQGKVCSTSHGVDGRMDGRTRGLTNIRCRAILVLVPQLRAAPKRLSHWIGVFIIHHWPSRSGGGPRPAGLFL